MPWTMEVIERFIADQERQHAITRNVATELRLRATERFKGKKPGSAISGRRGATIFEGYPSIFQELKQSFGKFMETTDFIAFGKKVGKKRGRE